LDQEMSFVNRYLPYFRQRLITHLESAHLPFSALFIESSCRVQFLAPLPFSSALRAPPTLCCVSFSVPCLLSSFFFFFVVLGSICPGGYAGLSQG
jgi:hypothetical protein